VSLRFLSYNIRYGGTGREAPLASVIRACEPDVVVLQEATNPLVVARVAEKAGFPHWGSRPGHSTGFLSRLPVAHHAWHTTRGARHPFLEVVLDPPNPRIFGLHLSAWFSKWSERRRAREIRMLLDGIREHQEGFHLIAGDFNALAPGERLQLAQMPRWIRAMVWVSGRDIARTTIQVMLDERYADLWRRQHPTGEGYTFPTWGAHVRLDYIFTPDRFAGRVTECAVVRDAPDAAAASDHYPLMAVIAQDSAA
jgi:exodeoxyribonuclease III